MARTFNRRPMSVGTPSSSDIKQYFFNHCNWKGINQNRNFLLVDQETFADAKNVYVDDEGLLKSRLPVKHKSTIAGKTITDIKVLDDVVICTYIGTDGERYIGIIDNEVWSVDYKIYSDYPIKAFRNGNYVYIFTNSKVLSYDVNSQTKSIVEANIYSPITRVYTSGNYEIFEDDNLLSSQVRYQYLLYPTLPYTENEIVLPSDALNSNVIGKRASYTHYINEDKITHTLEIDSNGDYLNLIHQPITYDTKNYYTTNVYNAEVPTVIIHNDQIFKYDAEKYTLSSASTGDLVFSKIWQREDKNGNFVKIKVQPANFISIIYDDCIKNISFTGEEKDISTPLEKVKYIDAVYVNYENLVLGDYVVKEEDYNNVKYYYFLPSPSGGVDYFTTSLVGPSFYYSMSLSTDLDLRFYEPTWYRIFSFSIFNNNKTYNNVVFAENINFYCVNGELQQLSGDAPRYTCNQDGIDSLFTGNNSPAYCRIYKEGNKIEFEVSVGEFISVGLRIRYGRIINNLYDTPTISSEYVANRTDMFYYLGNESCNLVDTLNNKLYFINLKDENKRYISEKVGKFVLPHHSNYWFYLLENEQVVLSNYRVITTKLNVNISKAGSISNPDLLLKGNSVYLTKGPTLYIGEIIIDPDDEQEKLYFKKSNKHILDSTINGLHQISDNELAIFTNDDTWYNTLSEGIYYYVRSKIVPTLKNKSHLITLPDSTTTLMPSKNGIIALSYQNFVNTAEQSTANITQDLTGIYSEFDNSILNCNWKSYTIFYQKGKSIMLIFDNRYNSWWRWILPLNLDNLFVYDNKLYFLSNGSIYEFSDSSEYYDLNSPNSKIDWYVESQKLHLNANNYYKHISNITLSSVQEGDTKLSLNLNVKNYRKWVDNGKAENFDYLVDVIRTYIKRVNYAKVCEFQYRLSSDNTQAKNVPLALSNITIKYKIGGQVR